MENPMKEIKETIKENRDNPANARAGQVVTFKGTKQINSIHLSGIKGQSHFDSYKKHLITAQKKLRVGSGCYGWITSNDVEVVVEKIFELPPKYFDKYPEEKEDYYKYMHAKRRCVVTKFYIQKKNGERKVYEHYGELVKDPFLSGDD